MRLTGLRPNAYMDPFLALTHPFSLLLACRASKIGPSEQRGIATAGGRRRAMARFRRS